MRAILALLAMFSMAGCSNRAVYDNIQINRRNECLKLPPSEYGECMKGVDTSYDAYEKERQEVIKK